MWSFSSVFVLNPDSMHGACFEALTAFYRWSVCLCNWRHFW